MTYKEKKLIFSIVWRVYFTTASSYSAVGAAEDAARKLGINEKEAVAIAYRVMAKCDEIFLENKALFTVPNKINGYFSEMFKNEGEDDEE